MSETLSGPITLSFIKDAKGTCRLNKITDPFTFRDRVVIEKQIENEVLQIIEIDPVLSELILLAVEIGD